MTVQDLKATPLLRMHEKDKAKLVPFAGWQMPVEYAGILQEHRVVRSDKGIFDLSHMGEIEFPKNLDSFSFLQSLATNDLAALVDGQALYTVMCKEDGGILDDMVVYNLPEKFLLVVNASNTDKILKWLEKEKSTGGNLRWTNTTDETALLAIQGPQAGVFLQPLSSVHLSEIGYYHAVHGEVAGVPCLISRTGYTGEDGFELYAASGQAEKLWEVLRGKGILPIGLGARDTLRLEAGYLLYGNDMDEATTPLEAGLAWVVRLGKENFIGKDALLKQKEEGIPRKLIGLTMSDRAVPRKGYPILVGGKKTGEVTSGTYSPTLEKGIGLGYVETSAGSFKEGAEIQVEIRGSAHPAVISKKSFVKGSANPSRK